MRNIIIGPVTPVIDLLDEFEENKSTCNWIVTQQIGDPTGFQYNNNNIIISRNYFWKGREKSCVDL